MKPNARWPWRKTLRDEAKGVETGGPVRPVQTEPPRRGSTWVRRHRWQTPS
jgi:hypothetical protein